MTNKLILNEWIPYLASELESGNFKTYSNKISIASQVSWE